MDIRMAIFQRSLRVMTQIVIRIISYTIDRACGIDDDVKDYPYIYFVTPNSKYLYRTVCVSSCP